MWKARVDNSQLTRVFDKWIWLLILISMISAMVPLLSQFETNTEQWSNCMASMKVLLEQGNPFQEKLTKQESMRWVISLFLLMGIVLSNAYKNSNVLNMIAPRKPIPYELFKELIEDNFTIFTRTESLTLSPYMEEDEIPKWIKFKSSFFVDTGPLDFLAREDYAALIVSEIASMVYNVLIAYKLLYTWNTEVHVLALGNSSLVASGIRSKSEFVTSVSGEMEKLILSEHPQIDNYNYTFRNEALRKIFSIFKEREDKLFYDRLNRCDKVAIVLPAHLCYHHLEKLKIGKYVSVGTEAFQDVEWMFTLNGIIPVEIPKRIKGIHEGGIWDRWLQMVKRKEVRAGNAEITAARLDGNIILIFLLWVVGLVVSVVCILMECRLVIWYFINTTGHLGKG